MAKVGQPATEPLLVGIQHPAKHEFAAGIDDFNLHADSVVSIGPTGKSGYAGVGAGKAGRGRFSAAGQWNVEWFMIIGGWQNFKPVVG